jgi:hypothetical protein
MHPLSLPLFTALAGLAAAIPTKELTARTDAPFGIKKGLAYNDGSITSILSRQNSATWAYNWGTALNAPQFQQIPMYWGPGSEGDASGVNAKIAKGDTPWVLGYNEPDETYGKGGCQATVDQAYAAWGNDMFQFQEQGVKLVCPAVTSWNTTSGATGGPSGLTWLRKFARYTNNPGEFRCSAANLHWYGVDGLSGADQANLFIQYIAAAHNDVDDMFRVTDMEIWVTEFSPLPLNDTQLMSDFLSVAMPYLDAQSWIGRYSPFKAEYLVTNGALNVAGNTFVNTF